MSHTSTIRRKGDQAIPIIPRMWLGQYVVGHVCVCTHVRMYVYVCVRTRIRGRPVSNLVGAACLFVRVIIFFYSEQRQSS